MSVTEKTQIGTIDLTPTWEQQVQTCITILQNTTNALAIKEATDELLRMGRLIDHVKANGGFRGFFTAAQ